MSWATRRRVVVLMVLAMCTIAFGAVVFISAVYQSPSCVDRVQNQDETGIDCGGPCPYLCVDQQIPPTILFTQAVGNGAGRIDVIASVENKNIGVAAEHVPYQASVYGPNQRLLRKVTGSIDLPPATSEPIFIPGIASSQEGVTAAFLEIDPAAPKWFSLTSDPRIIPTVSNTTLGGSVSAPRIESTLSNPSSVPLTNVPVVVLVRNAQGNVIAASSTLIPRIDPQGAATALFTWNGAFLGTATKIEVVPVMPLPTGVGPVHG